MTTAPRTHQARHPLLPKLMLGLLTILGVLAICPTAHAQNALGKEAIFISIANPITTEAVARVRNRVEASRNHPARPIRTVVFDFTPAGKDAQTPDYGVCYSLASYIGQLFELDTIAYVSANLSGHSVLPALACKEIVLAKAGSLGPIVQPGEPFTDAMKAGYDEILGSARAPFQAVVWKMADPGVSLGKGKRNGIDWYLDLRQKDQFMQGGGVIPDPTPLAFAGPGTPGVFTAERALNLGLVKVTAESRQELVELYGLNPSSLRESPIDDRPSVVAKYVMRGNVDNGVKEATRRVIQDQIRQQVTLLFVQIECGEGDLTAARDIAEIFITAQQGDSAMQIVGFVPESTTPAGTLIALGCSELVMSKRSDVQDAMGVSTEAEIGDFETILNREDPAAIEFLRTNLKELLAFHGNPEVLVDGFLDRDVTILRVHAANERGRKRLMTDRELEAVKADWVSEMTIKPKGQLLKLNATRAVELGVARYATENRSIEQVYQLYGVDSARVREATPGWLDRFSTFLRLPPVTVLLVVIGFAGLVLELKVPGTTVPGITAALCFILIFWAHTGVNGNASILGGMLFLLGLVLVLIEVFVLPGFGAAGLLGILFMLGGIGIATLDKIPQTGDEWIVFGGKMGQYMLAMIGSVILAFTIARFLPNIPYANRLMLAAPPERLATEPNDELPGAAVAAALLGAVGTAATTLRPSGMAQFGDQYIDVVTEGGFIASGARIQVIEVEGTRIVVREV